MYNAPGLFYRLHFCQKLFQVDFIALWVEECSEMRHNSPKFTAILFEYLVPHPVSVENRIHSRFTATPILANK